MTEVKWMMIVIYLAGINLITFAVYGIDKMRAKKNRWRIPEKTLFLLAIVGGSVGAWLGMQYFHHKTKHMQFKIGIPLIFIIQIICAGYIYFH